MNVAIEVEMSQERNISIVAGGAGFVGVNLCSRLLEEGRTLVVLDNMSRGRESLVRVATRGFDDRVYVLRCDCTDEQALEQAFEQAVQLGRVDEVWHLAANSDIPAGVEDSRVDLKDTFLTTFELLRVMREFDVGTLHFASSSAIYGDLGDTALEESVGPLLPISNYGAMKLASEAAIAAASESFLTKVNIFRFPNVVGVPATHGVIFDFVQKLIARPDALSVLGDGTQQKAYLHVSDLVEAMLVVRGRTDARRIEVVNIGPVDEGVTVRWIAESTISRVQPPARAEYGQGNRGWVGDVPKFHYSTARIQAYGWKPKLGSDQAVSRAIDEIATQFGR
ncbi:SDR family NAD(P)-dependent oxidoreductase [Pandoraea cepalis]|nr:SDR family NAD(P)-dependent oxidoreductase [Pandoraea cepalis]